MTLRLVDAVYRYAGTSRPVLDGLSLTVEAGTVTGVVGPNEAGKSTLCLVSSGLAPASIAGRLEGSVTLDGVETATLRPHELAQRCGVLFQNPTTQLSGTAVTVFEEVAFGPRNLGLDVPEIVDRVWWALGTLGIESLAPRNPDRLSGGQAQLVALASVLALRPPYLVLDEPTSQLDPQGTRQVGDALATLAGETGTAILIVEHKTELLARMTGRVAVIEAGRIVREGPTGEVLADPDLPALGVDPPASIRLRRALAAGDGRWERVVAAIESVGTWDGAAAPPADGVPGPDGSHQGSEAPRSDPAASSAASPPAGGSPGPVGGSPGPVGGLEPSRAPTGDAAGPGAGRAPASGSTGPATRDTPGASPHGAPAGVSIEVRSVVFDYPDGTRALRGVDLRIGPGERLAIIGQNGSGKSTLVRQLNGLLRPTHGLVLLDGRDVTSMHVAQLAAIVGLAFQNPDRQIFAGRVRTEVAFGPRNLGLRDDALDSAVRGALEAVGLAGEVDGHPYDLGYSRRKLLSLASVLAMRTPVVVLDEPTTGQDARGVGRIREIVGQLSAEGRTVVTISHDMRFVAETFERVVVMRAGEIILDGSAADVFAAPHWPELASTYLEPPLAARVGERLGLGPTPTERGLVEALQTSD